MSELDLFNQSVSVVMATRNRPELLRRAIKGILDQEHDHPIEIVVVFDHCDVDSDVQTFDPRRLVRVMNNDGEPGLAGARNCGISNTTHPWVAFCDDDDEWLEGKLSAQFAALEANPGAGFATCGLYINFNDADTERIPDPAKMTFEGFLNDRMTEAHPSGFLMAKSVLDEIGPVDEDLPGSYAEDYDFLLRASQVTKMVVAEKPLIRVYWHGSSFFFERWKTIDDALGYLLNKYPEFGNHPKGLARILGQRAVAQAAMSQRGQALRTIGRTLRSNPLEKRVPVAIAVAAGVPAGRVLQWLHKSGKGI